MRVRHTPQGGTSDLGTLRRRPCSCRRVGCIGPGLARGLDPVSATALDWEEGKEAGLAMTYA